MKTHRLIIFLAAAILSGASPSPGLAAAAEDCSACQPPLDANAILREIELKVDKQQYEKVLTAINEAEMDIQTNVPSEFPGGPTPEQVKSLTQSTKARLDGLEKIAERLRERIYKNVAETNKRMELAEGEKQKKTPKPPGLEQSQVLQGKWKGVEVGREAEGNCAMDITRDTIHFQGADKNEWYKATYTIVADDPAQIHATITDCPAPDFVGKSSVAIYKIEDGKLTLLGNKPGSPEAPKSFVGDADSRTFIFKRTP